MGCEMYNPRITFPRALSASSASPQIQAASVSMGDSRLRLERSRCALLSASRRGRFQPFKSHWDYLERADQEGRE